MIYDQPYPTFTPYELAVGPVWQQPTIIHCWIIFIFMIKDPCSEASKLWGFKWRPHIIWSEWYLAHCQFRPTDHHYLWDRDASRLVVQEGLFKKEKTVLKELRWTYWISLPRTYLHPYFYLTFMIHSLLVRRFSYWENFIGAYDNDSGHINGCSSRAISHGCSSDMLASMAGCISPFRCISCFWPGIQFINYDFQFIILMRICISSYSVAFYCFCWTVIAKMCNIIWKYVLAFWVCRNFSLVLSW